MEYSNLGITALAVYALMPGDIKSCQCEQIFQLSMSSMTVTSAALSRLTPRAVWEVTYDQLMEKEVTQWPKLFGSWVGQLGMWVQIENR